MPKKPVVFKTKLGTAKGVERSRIWIEGQRLVDAGFTVGRYFAKVYENTTTQLELVLLVEDDVLRHPGNAKNGHRLILSLCDYSGKWAQPYIDAGYRSISTT
jgi:hypothetical protein